jgi:hypothetical protein
MDRVTDSIIQVIETCNNLDTSLLLYCASVSILKFLLCRLMGMEQDERSLISDL